MINPVPVSDVPMYSDAELRKACAQAREEGAAAALDRIRQLAAEHGAVCHIAEVTQGDRRVGGRTVQFADLLGGDLS